VGILKGRGGIRVNGFGFMFADELAEIGIVIANGAGIKQVAASSTTAVAVMKPLLVANTKEWNR